MLRHNIFIKKVILNLRKLDLYCNDIDVSSWEGC